MNRSMKITFLLATITLASCATSTPQKQSNLSLDQAELVSRDFVSAISKLRGFSPRETTVQFHMPATEFGKALHDEMRLAGYGMQILPKDEAGNNHVSYVSESYETTDGTTVAYEVSIGNVSLGREYEVRLGRVFPIAALAVNGAQPSSVNTVDNSIFSENVVDELALLPNPTPMPTAVVIPAETPTAIASSTLEQPPARRLPSTIVSVGEPASESIRTPRASLNAEDENHINLGNLHSSLNAPSNPPVNIATLGDSNYSSLFNLYSPVRKESLTFPDDSLVMGRQNKNTIANFSKHFNPETDVISVIGCSNGTTKIKNGNALLANGRANRVKEELITLDISPEYVFEEGCWAPNKHSVMPSRGVLLTLRRKITNG